MRVRTDSFLMQQIKIAALLVALSVSGEVGAENRLFIGSHRVPLQAERARVPVRLDSDVPIAGIQLSIETDASALAIAGVEVAGTLAETADWSGGQVNDTGGRLSWGLIVDLDAPRDAVLSPGTGHRIVDLELEVRAAAPTFSPVRFTDFAGSPPAKNKLVTVDGTNVTFTAVTGIIEITEDADTEFIRGDSNADQTVDLSDGIFTLNYLFLGSTDPGCSDAADANDNGAIDLSDAVFTFDHLFLGGAPPPPPFPSPGPDPTPDDIECDG